MTATLLRPVAAVLRAARKTTGYGLPGLRPVFVHIPKTGGRSIGRMLKKAYWGHPTIWVPPTREAFERMAKTPAFRRYAVYRGHIRASYADMVPNAFVFTFLREPRDRMLSEYYYHRSLADRPMSLTTFLQSETTKSLTKSLVGEADADAAIEALSKMHFVGLLEEFERDTRLLLEKLGRRPVEPVKWKPTCARVELEDLAPGLREALDQRTAEDRKVYDWAVSQRQRG